MREGHPAISLSLMCPQPHNKHLNILPKSYNNVGDNMIAIQETYSLSSGTTTSHYTIHDHLCKHLRSYDGDESFGNHWKTLRFDNIRQTWNITTTW